MRILLVRHGQSLANIDKTLHERVPDHAIPLSDRGHEQALAAGEFIGNYLADELASFKPHDRPPVRLWVNPYRRTRETADRIEEGVALSQGWITDRREHVLLCEQQFGPFDGIPDEELPIRFPKEGAHYHRAEAFEGRFWARMPLGESRFDVAQRVHQAFGTFHRDARREGVENLVVVCHGVTLRAFLMMWLHLTPEWFESKHNPRNCAVRVIDHGRDLGYVYEGGA